MAEYDLTQVRLHRLVNTKQQEYLLTFQKLIPHLDRHLAIPLLAHLSELEIFPADQIARAQYDLVKGTNMVDYVQQLHEQIGGEVTGEQIITLENRIQVG